VYARVLLVSDSTREGLVALHEGALVARSAGAEVFLLIVEREHPALTIADAIHPLPVRGVGEPLLETGLVRLRGLGLMAQGATAQGEPARVIADYARAFRADLVMVGRRRQSRLDRWWWGDSGADLIDRLPCSVLFCRSVASSAALEAQGEASAEVPPEGMPARPPAS